MHWKKKKAWISWKTFAKPLCIPMLCITGSWDSPGRWSWRFSVGRSWRLSVGWTWRLNTLKRGRWLIVVCVIVESICHVFGKYLMHSYAVDWFSNVVMKCRYTRGLGISGDIWGEQRYWMIHSYSLCITFCINGQLYLEKLELYLQ